jgi:hypothetical protein
MELLKKRGSDGLSELSMDGVVHVQTVFAPARRGAVAEEAWK